MKLPRHVCLLFVLSVCEFAWGAIVYTESGRVNGTKFTTYRGRVVDAFLGIPYAKPPVGENRFRDPQPIQKWGGIRSTDTFGSICIQYTYYRDLPVPVEGDEDCLFLNIYTPNPSNSTKLNVIVYIHGGCFMVGTGSRYTPYYILDYTDLVFITLNYRVGPFGFLSTEDNVIPGNFGLKDQVMALKWIKNNVGYFGGDENKITLMGTSAGGASVHLHYMSPLSKDLFKNGISESGTALDPWAFTEDPLQKAKMLSAAVGCPTTTSKEILECLRTKDAVSLLLPIQRLFLPWVFNPFSPFGPVVEPKSEDAFLTKNPYNVVLDGEVKDAPWITLITTEDGLYPVATFMTNVTLMQELDDNWDTLAPHLLDFNYTVAQEQLAQVSKSIRQHYFGERRINNESIDVLVRLLTDRMFGVGVEKAVRLQASVSKSPVYFFVYGYRGSRSSSQSFCNCKEYFGASHGDSLILRIRPNETEHDKIIIESMVHIWTTYVNFSVPFVSRNFYIPPISPDIREEGNLTFLFFSSSSEVRSTADFTDRKFWDGLDIMENEKAMHVPVYSGSSRKLNIISIAQSILTLILLLLLSS